MAVLDSSRSAQIVVLRGDVGRGKTYAVQRFYDLLCERRPSSTWAPGLTPVGVPSTSSELDAQRKGIRARRQEPVTGDTPWLWLSATCTPSRSDFDSAASQLAEQLDDLVQEDGLGRAAGRALVETATDVVLEATQLGLIKTLYETGMRAYRLNETRKSLQPADREETARGERAAVIEAALLRLRVGSARRPRPLIAVLDDADLATPHSLALLSTLLMPGTGSDLRGRYFPGGTDTRQGPVLVVVARWRHTDGAPAYAQDPLNVWLQEAAESGVPVTAVDLPNGMPRSAAVAQVRDSFPGLRETDAELLTGQQGRAVNPLVVKMRISMVLGHMPDARALTSLDDIDLSRLPASPLDPIRDRFEALPPEEKRLIGRLASLGQSAPLELLTGEPRSDAREVLRQALETGLVATSDDPLNVVGFMDDLSVAYFEQAGPHLLMRGAAGARADTERLLAWLDGCASGADLPVAVLPEIARLMTMAARTDLLADADEVPLAASSTGEGPPPASLPGNVLGRFSAGAAGWTDTRLGREVLLLAAVPKRISPRQWARLFSLPAVRRYQARNPGALASRAVALHEWTMVAPELQGPLLAAFPLDGARALVRLVEAAHIFGEFDLGSHLQEIADREPDLRDSIRYLRAQAAGPTSVAELADRDRDMDTDMSEDARLLASEAYSSLGRHGDAAKVLIPLASNPERAMRAARHAMLADDEDTAIALLTRHSATSLDALLALADALPDVDDALARLSPFYEVHAGARIRASQLLAAAKRFPEAAAVLGPLEGRGDAGVETALRSIRSRRAGTSREEILAQGAAAWERGDATAAADQLQEHLDDPVIASVWAEYAWVLGRTETVIAELRRRRIQAPTLSVTLAELANELPEEARASGWLVDEHADVDMRLGQARLLHVQGGARALEDAGPEFSAGAERRAADTVRSLTRGEETASAHLRIAISLEEQGQIEWALHVLREWPDDALCESHELRLLSEYGRVRVATARLSQTKTRTATMTCVRAINHLVSDPPGPAGEAFARHPHATPQMLRLAELIPRVRDEPQAAILAGRLLAQMGQWSSGVILLATAVNALPHEHPDLRRAYDAARVRTPVPQRLAYARLRKRYAIRDAFDEAVRQRSIATP